MVMIAILVMTTATPGECATQVGVPHYYRKAVKHVMCGTCQAVVQHAIQAAIDLHTVHKTYVDSEDVYMDLVDNACFPGSASSAWARLLDMEFDPDARIIDLVQVPKSACGPTCTTLLMACREVVDEVLSEDLGYLLWTNGAQSLKAIQNILTKIQCDDACPEKPLPKGIHIDIVPRVPADDEMDALESAAFEAGATLVKDDL